MSRKTNLLTLKIEIHLQFVGWNKRIEGNILIKNRSQFNLTPPTFLDNIFPANNVNLRG